MIRKLLFFLLINCSVVWSVAGQNLAKTYAFAKEQQALRNFQISADAFERIIYFDSLDSYPDVYACIAGIYFELNAFEEAARYFQIAMMKAPSDSIRKEYSFQKALSYYALGQFDQSIIELIGMQTIHSSYFTQKKNYLLGLNYFLKEEFATSKNYMTKFADANDDIEDQLIDQIFEENTKAEKINPQLAMWLSVVVPGLGQCIYGNFEAGLNSFILTAGLSTLYLTYVSSFSLVEGYIVVLPWFQRYHRGGYQNAKRLAIEKQKSIRKESFIKLVDLIN